MIRQIDGPDLGPLGTLYRPEVLHRGRHRVPRLPERAAVSRVARLRAAVERGDQLVWDANIIPIGTAGLGVL